MTDPADLCRPERAPEWLRPLVDATRDVDASELFEHRPLAPPDGRRAAVLVLLANHPAYGPDVLLVERASTLRTHAGQVAFPGGAADADDAHVIATALREAQEEAGIDPAGVVPLTILPELYVPVSRFAVTPVLAHWARPTAVRAVDPRETARVVRVPIADLADPDHRLRVRHPSGTSGPAFQVMGLLIWGFTGGILSALLDRAGWARPWDTTRVVDLDSAWSAARAGRREVAGS